MTVCQILSSSMEDYLEAIYHIISEKGAARAKDISKQLKVGASSVTGALKALKERGMVNYAPYDVITLTSRGEEAALDVILRHEVLRDFMIKVLAVDEADADAAACRMEHSITKNILERFIQFAEFVEVCPRGGAKWIAGFGYRCDHDSSLDNCESCISQCLKGVREKQKQQEKKTMTSVSLKSLKKGQRAKIVKVRTTGSASKRIVEMGVTPGSLVEVERIAPLGDPIDVRIRGYHLSLRKDEIETIDVELI